MDQRFDSTHWDLDYHIALLRVQEGHTLLIHDEDPPLQFVHLY